MKVNFLILTLLALASFRLTRLIVFDKITEFLREPFFDEYEEKNQDGTIEVYYLPKKQGIKKFFGELLSCYWCTGVWCSFALVLLYDLFPDFSLPFLLFLAVAGMASILETIVQLMIEK